MTLTLISNSRTALIPARDAAAPAASVTEPAGPWLLGAGTPYPVLDQLAAAGWSIVLDHRADYHCASPDGRVYIGYLDEYPHAAPGELWHIVVEGDASTPGWTQTFGRDVPSEVVAGFVEALVANPARPEPR